MKSRHVLPRQEVAKLLPIIVSTDVADAENWRVSRPDR